jgi:hypothetical protein
MSGNVIDATFVHSYERQMAVIQESEYVRRLSSKFTWWTKISKTRQLDGATERLAWFLETARITAAGPAGTGSMTFEELAVQQTVYPTFVHNDGIKVQRAQLKFLNGNGLNALAEWSRQIGNEIAYYPQRLMAQMILNGGNNDGSANAYDGVPFFVNPGTFVTGTSGATSTGHPVNPMNTQLGYFFNDLTGAQQTITQPNGSTYVYPGALPIDDTQTVDQALTNLGKIISFISTVKMPNGVDPRFLTPVYIMAPPRMAPRLRELTKAKFIAQAAGSSAGSADVEALIYGWGLGEPIIVQEFQAAQTYSAKMPFVIASSGNVGFMPETCVGSDTTFYVVCVEASTTQLGAFLYLTSDPFKVTYYTGDAGGTGMDAILDRLNEFEYHVQGMVSTGFGHPYSVFRCQGS